MSTSLTFNWIMIALWALVIIPLHVVGVVTNSPLIAVNILFIVIGVAFIVFNFVVINYKMKARE